MSKGVGYTRPVTFSGGTVTGGTSATGTPPSGDPLDLDAALAREPAGYLPPVTTVYDDAGRPFSADVDSGGVEVSTNGDFVTDVEVLEGEGGGLNVSADGDDAAPAGIPWQLLLGGASLLLAALNYASKR